ncbi:hypothetical protein DEO72_LG10g1638 [Vigna unguiculata]|uniref:Uncharacterized protein n=1 Tax=Vigna unguiculata TaxID=3917 RepID=A0A4D6NAS1_VIGUN|nr:hypothetical protein DEO72_LG10g1638 [Vigna unguiculata]
MAALCPGQDQCSLAIYLSSIQQTVKNFILLVGDIHKSIYFLDGKSMVFN